MSEHTPGTYQQSNEHEEIAAKVKAAASDLPEHVTSIDEGLEGVTRISGRPNGNGSGVGGNFVQHSQVDGGRDIVIGRIEIDQAVPKKRNLGSYGFRSVENQGVEEASVRRLVASQDMVTRAGAANYHREGTVGSLLYEHEFRDEHKGQVGKLIADIAIQQAARTRPTKSLL